MHSRDKPPCSYPPNDDHDHDHDDDDDDDDYTDSTDDDRTTVAVMWL